MRNCVVKPRDGWVKNTSVVLNGQRYMYRDTLSCRFIHKLDLNVGEMESINSGGGRVG